MVVESQHTHARMVHGSRCMRDAHVLSALTNVGDSCVLKRAKTSSHDITIDPRYSFDLTIKFLQCKASFVPTSVGMNVFEKMCGASRLVQQGT